MTYWQDNYAFVKEVYEMRRDKMDEWMNSVEAIVQKMQVDKAYTGQEFHKLKESFQNITKDVEKEQVKAWLASMIETLNEGQMEHEKLQGIIKRHRALMPTIERTAVKTEVFTKCYAYGDEILPLIKFLEEMRTLSVRPIHPINMDQVDEMIEAQEEIITKLDERKKEAARFLEKGKRLLTNPDSPNTLKGYVQNLEDTSVDTNQKALDKLKMLKETHNVWQEYDDQKIEIAKYLDQAEEELKKIKPNYDHQKGAIEVEEKKNMASKLRGTIEEIFAKLKKNCEMLSLVAPPSAPQREDEVKEISGRMEILNKIDKKVAFIEDINKRLTEYVTNSDEMKAWLVSCNKLYEQLVSIGDTQAPEDKLLLTVELKQQTDAKLALVTEKLEKDSESLFKGRSNQLAQDLLADFEDYKEKVKLIHQQVETQAGDITADLTFWAEYQTNLKIFKPWLVEAEARIAKALTKPNTLPAADAMLESVKAFDAEVLEKFQILKNAEDASLQMASHGNADVEIKKLKDQWEVIDKAVKGRVAKMEELTTSWKTLNSTVTTVSTWVAAAEPSGETAEVEAPNFELLEQTIANIKERFLEKQKLIENL